ASAVWANPDSESNNPIESTDAPKMRAREILAPSAILPQSKDLILGLAGVRPRNVASGLLATKIHSAGHPPAFRSSSLRRGNKVVKDGTAQFISIVNCSDWMAAAANCTNNQQGNVWGAAKRIWRQLLKTVSKVPKGAREVLHLPREISR